VWGYGILGLGPNVETLSEPQMLPEPLFGKTPFSPDGRVVDVQAGMSHFAAIVKIPKKFQMKQGKEIPDLGEVYTWGANRRGCLGFGHEDNQYFPLKLILPASVNQISCGTNHTVALCDPLLL
jgi:alpha-tubulin suppressor-like RCC1 family protein